VLELKEIGLAKKVIEVRLKFLKRYSERLKHVALFLVLSFIVLICVKWLIIMPYINRLITLAEAGDVTGIQEELSKLPSAVKVSPLLYSIGLILLALSSWTLITVLHGALKIQYSMTIDSARLLLFFSFVSCCLSALFWAGLFYAFSTGDSETIVLTTRSIFFAERMCRLCFSASAIAFSYHIFKLAEIVNKIYGVPKKVLLLLFIVNLFSIFDIIFTLPFYLYLNRKRKIIHVFAYLDIKIDWSKLS